MKRGSEASRKRKPHSSNNLQDPPSAVNRRRRLARPSIPLFAAEILPSSSRALDAALRLHGRLLRGEAMKATRFMRIGLFAVMLSSVFFFAGTLYAQEGSKDAQSGENSAESGATKRLTIEVSGGEKNVAVENASVYLKYVEERKLSKDRKYALNVKTNRSGIAHIPDPPLGRVLIQIVADGWKTYGKYYELSEPGAVIKIHLDRPPKWY
jgi:hypothetical protein